MVEQLLIVIRFRAALVALLGHDIFMLKHLVRSCEVTPDEHVGLLKVVKEVLLMDSLGHP